MHFDPRHHGTLGDHNHSVVIKSNDLEQPSLEIPTAANVVDV